MKQFEAPEMQVIHFGKQDIIATSSTCGCVECGECPPGSNNCQCVEFTFANQ